MQPLVLQVRHREGQNDKVKDAINFTQLTHPNFPFHTFFAGAGYGGAPPPYPGSNFGAGFPPQAGPTGKMYPAGPLAGPTGGGMHNSNPYAMSGIQQVGVSILITNCIDMQMLLGGWLLPYS